MNIVFLVYYFPPINSSGAKRIEAISKYLAAEGFNVTVITTKKTASDGEFTEVYPEGVNVIELNRMGKKCKSVYTDGRFEPMYIGKPSWHRRIKDFVMRLLGQVPDPRLPFAFTFVSPFLDSEVCTILKSADAVIGSAPPWPMLLAAVFCKKRFKIPCILDYRDQFSDCHEMPGGRFAKWLELKIDKWLVGKADNLVAISQPMATYYKNFTSDVTCILNGYDHKVLEKARDQVKFGSSNKTTIRYMGIVSPGRVPHQLMSALVEYKKANEVDFQKLSIEFYGNAALIEEALLMLYPSIKEVFFIHGPVPYLESLKLIVSADYLLFSETSSSQSLSAQGILTTKLFEYLGAGRPIIGNISKKTLAGSFLTRGHPNNIIGDSDEVFIEALSAADFHARKSDHISEFSRSLSRQSQALQYAELIKNKDR